jgi:hypothetical protein
VVGPHGRDSTLRQWGLHLASRRKQAVPQSGHRRRRSQAGSTASSHLDHPGAIHPVLWSSSLMKEIMSNCCNYPAPR